MIMKLFGGSVTTELLIIYALIAFVIILIVVILIVDKKFSRRIELFDPRKLSKRLVSIDPRDDFNPRFENNEMFPEKIMISPIEGDDEMDDIPSLSDESYDYEPDEVIKESLIIEPRVLEKSQLQIDIENVKPVTVEVVDDAEEEISLEEEEIDNYNSHLIEPVQLALEDIEFEKPIEIKKKDRESIISTEALTQEEDDSDIYIESDLEKTQAQIDVAEITGQLETAIDNGEKDKYAKFEEEQEQSAIISYNELEKVYDKLYDENEKTQYLDDDKIPINLEELYRLTEDEDEILIEEPKVEPLIVEQTIKESSATIDSIEKKEESNEFKEIDEELKKTNDFLASLRELRKN